VNFLDEFDTHHGSFDRITLAEVMPYEDYCGKRFNQGIALKKELESTKTTFGITMQTSCTKGGS
jgi:hypothetical protein